MASATLHRPGSTSSDHGLVVITYDGDGNVTSTEFISYDALVDPGSGALSGLTDKLNQKGLVAHFKVALDALAGYCDKKGNIAAVFSVIGAGAGVTIGAKALGGVVLGAAAIPLGATVGLGSAVYLASMAIYWNSNENTVRTINDYVD